MEVTEEEEVTEEVAADLVDSSVIVTKEVTDTLMSLLISARDTINAF